MSESPAYSASETGRSPLIDRWGLVAALAGCLFLLVAGTGRSAPPESSAPDPGSLSVDGNAAATDSLIRATDLLKVRHLDDVHLSPDGRSIAYTVRRIVGSDAARSGTASGENTAAYRYETHLYVVPTGGRSAPRALTRSAAGASDPAWHPESDWIAFVRPVDGTPQIFVLSLTGGEPVQLTDAPHGATDPVWSPRGDRLLFATTVPGDAVRDRGGPPVPSERPGRSPRDTLRTVAPDTAVVLRDSTTLDPVDTLDVALRDSLRLLSDSLGLLRDTVRLAPDRTGLRASPDGDLLQVRKWLDRRRSDGDAHVTHRLDFQGEQALDPSVSYRHYRVVSVPETLFHGTAGPRRSQPVTQGPRSFADAAWLPNGSQIVVSAPPASDRHPDRVRDRDLFLAEVDGSGLRRLLDLEHYALSDPRITPDGTTVAFRAHDLRTPGYTQAEIGLFALDGRTKPQLITEDFDRDVSAPTWSPDGWYLYTTAPSEGGVPLYRLAPFGRSDTTDAPDAPLIDGEGASRDTFAIDTSMTRRVPRERLTAQTRGVQSFDVTEASVAYVASSAANPSELYANTVGFSREQRLSRHNAWIENRRLATPQRFTVTRDTLTIDAWVMRPPTLADTSRAPLLLQIHGGPMSMWGPAEPTMWHEFQYLAAQGYAVVFANPRGSGGYGNRFRRLNAQDWGPGPAGDVLAAADAAAERSWIDASQQVVTGGSYGGYLTAWIVSQTDRFDAAVTQRGVYDLPTFFGEGNAWRLVPYHFGGYPWDGSLPPPAGTSDSLAASAPDASGTPGSESSATEGADAPPADAFSASSVTPADTLLSPRDALIRNSPMTYAHRIRTPLLILHGSQDLRTGVSQSERLYRTLKVLERPVEYVRYPGAGHDLSRSGAPIQRLDRVLRIHEFFARYVDLPSGSPDDSRAASRP